MRTAIVVGNPKPRSRTYEAARLVVERLTDAAPNVVLDLVDIAPALLDWSDPTTAEAVTALQGCELVVVASPTYKGAYTGLLKLFLDRIAGGALAGVTAVPLMLGGDWRHSLAPEVFLKPVLAELGASCPTRGLFLLDSDYAYSEVLTSWLEQFRRMLGTLPAGIVRQS